MLYALQHRDRHFELIARIAAWRDSYTRYPLFSLVSPRRPVEKGACPIKEDGTGTHARFSSRSPAFLLRDSPLSSFRFPSAVLLLVDRNKQQQSTRSPRRVGGSIRRRRRNIGAKEKGERCDGILLPDGNTSGRKGERERGVARKWTDRRKRLATGFFPSTDAERRRRRTARSPSKISAIFRRTHYRTPRGKLAFPLLLPLLFFSFYSSRRARNVARFPACTSAAEVLDRARRKRRSEVSLPETDPAC